MCEKPTPEQPLIRMSTEDFVRTGLVWFVNQLLHAFGFMLSYDIDEKTGVHSDFYICRTIFRGHAPGIDDEGYERVARYLKDNAADLYAEAEYPVPEDFVHNDSNDPPLPG